MKTVRERESVRKRVGIDFPATFRWCFRFEINQRGWRGNQQAQDSPKSLGKVSFGDRKVIWSTELKEPRGGRKSRAVVLSYQARTARFLMVEEQPRGTPCSSLFISFISPIFFVIFIILFINFRTSFLL